MARQTASTSATIGDSRSGSAFIGRERELTELHGGVVDALSGRGSMFLVTGEPGIGKTSVAAEVTAFAREEGFSVGWGKCWEGLGAPAYWPWVQILRAIPFDTISPEADRRTEILAKLEEHCPAESGSGPSASESEHARFFLFDSIGELFLSAADERPLLLVLDDLHAADVTSLLLLEFAANHLFSAPIVIVGTYRDAEARSSGERFDLLRRIARQGRLLALTGLTETEVSCLVGLNLAGAAPSGLVSALRHATNGNPLFLQGVIRLLAARSEGGRPLEPGGSFAIPAQVRDAIGRRLGALSGEAREVLDVAALIGKELVKATLRRVANLRAGAFDRAMAEILADGILLEEGDGSIRFSHGLVSETLADEMPAARRTLLHRRIGNAMESGRGGAAALAYHFFEAGDPASLGKALRYTALAGDLAMEQMAYEEAVKRYQAALRVLTFKKAPDVRRRCELLVSLGEARSRTGDLPAAQRDLGEAAALARALQEPELLARAALGFMRWEEVIVDGKRLGLLEEALRFLRPEDHPLRARVLSRLAKALRTTNQIERRRALSDEAVAMARRLGDPATLAEVLHGRIIATWGPDNLEERLSASRELLDLSEAMGDREWNLWGLVWQSAGLLEAGRITEMDQALERFWALAEPLPEPFYLWLAEFLRAMRAIIEGDFVEAERRAERARAAGAPTRISDIESVHWIQTFIIRREAGRLSEFETENIVTRFPPSTWRGALGQIHFLTGRKDDARRMFELSAASDFAAIPRDGYWLRAVSLLAELSIRLDDRRRSAILYDQLLPFARSNVVLGFPNACTGSASRQLGMLAHHLGRHEQAIAHLEEALRENRRMGMTPWAAHTEVELARVFLGCDDEAAARQHLSNAIRTARAFGMVALLSEAEALQAEAIGRGFAEGAPVARSNVPPAVGAAAPNSFRKEGDLWRIGFEGVEVRLRDFKGLADLAVLLGRPGERVHVAALVSAGSQTIDESEDSANLRSDGLSVRRLGHAGDGLDRKAAQDYRERLHQLRAELEGAEARGDATAAAQAREEIDFLRRELRAAFGLRGRPRRDVDVTERIRKAVTNRIRAAITRLADALPPLARHFEATLYLGTYCSYAPGSSVDWRL